MVCSPVCEIHRSATERHPPYGIRPTQYHLPADTDRLVLNLLTTEDGRLS